MSVLLYIDASFRVSGDGSDMQNDFLCKKAWKNELGSSRNGDGRRNLKKRSARLYEQIFTLLEGNQ